ncbi:MAG TPA: dTMP kinase [Usitatibacter sp.]|nr:dTMP kinase [Usitatibacter sp.]
MTRGKFITLEGIDGAGKSSHLDFLRQLVERRGHEARTMREPGGTPFGAMLRDVVLHQPTSALAEALAMFADRAAHVEAEIEPALASGAWVICDRFSDSTYAYQCGGRGLDRDVVVQLERIAHPGLQPDVTFLFDIDPAMANERQQRRNVQADGFEARGLDYFVRVRNAYLERAREHAARIRLVDASGDLETVRRHLERRFEEAFA